MLRWVHSPAPSLSASPAGALARPSSRQALRRHRPSSHETGTSSGPSRTRTRWRPRTSGPWAPAGSAVGGQLAIMAWRSLSDSSFVPRSAALLCVHARIAGWASSYQAPTVVDARRWWRPGRDRRPRRAGRTVVPDLVAQCVPLRKEREHALVRPGPEQTAAGVEAAEDVVRSQFERGVRRVAHCRSRPAGI